VILSNKKSSQPQLSNESKQTEMAANNSHTVPSKRLYSIKELVAHIGATEWFWRTQIWDGALPYIQVGKKMFVDRNDIDVFIASNRHQNG
jgi:hypothetical protein